MSKYLCYFNESIRFFKKMTDSDLKPDEQEEAQSPSLLPVGILSGISLNSISFMFTLASLALTIFAQTKVRKH